MMTTKVQERAIAKMITTTTTTTPKAHTISLTKAIVKSVSGMTPNIETYPRATITVRASLARK
jgi:hypothetical protein